MDQWWVHNVFNNQGIVPLVSWIVWVIASISLHELGHGVAAIRLGDSTPRDSGHMTWNPLVHMGQMSLIVFALVGIAWGMMPVDPSRLRGRHGDTIVSLAGPAVNLALAILCLIALPLWVWLAGGYASPSLTADDTLFKNMQHFLYAGAYLNLVLLMLNLMPILPLDGGRVVSNYSYQYREFAHSENGRWVMLGGLLLVFYFAAGFFFDLSESITSGVYDLILGVLAPETR